MKIRIFNTGSCIGSGKIACQTKPWKKVRFLSRVFLISTKKHGPILFDTGYGDAYFQNVSLVYDWVLPVQLSSDQNITAQLEKIGLAPSDISYLFISHFHVDHIAGLKSLRNIPWIYRKDSLEFLLNCSPLKAFKQGFFKKLLPEIPKGSIPITQNDFEHSFKGSALKSFFLFDDSELEVVDLPGHALGQMGLSLADSFFVADSVWSEESLLNGVLPSWIGLLLQHDRQAYIHTFKQIQAIQRRMPHLKCIPTHKMEDL